MREKAELAVAKVLAEVERDGKADLLKWWTFFATDTAASMMFGEDLGMLALGKVGPDGIRSIAAKKELITPAAYRRPNTLNSWSVL